MAYADWRRARAPPPDEVWAFVAGGRAGAFLLDTWGKDGLTLLDWMSRVEIDRLCRACRDAGVPIALAGSLEPQPDPHAEADGPDWFAVRGAACQGLQRTAAIDAAKVRGLVECLDEASRTPLAEVDGLHLQPRHGRLHASARTIHRRSRARRLFPVHALAGIVTDLSRMR